MENHKDQKRVSELIMILVFSAVIILLLIATLSLGGKKTSYYENRALSKLQTPETEDVMDGSFFTDLESFLSDHSAFREELLEFNTDLDLSVFKRPVVNDVVVGDDILVGYNSFDCNERDLSEKSIADFRKNLSVVKSACDEVGAPYYYVGFPEQHTFYPDKYPWYMNNLSDFEDREAEILNEIMPLYGISFIDLREELTGEDVRDIYSSKTDNHLSMRGAFEAYRIILERINEDWDESFRILDEDDVEFVRLANPYLGSMERKLMNRIDIDESLYYLEFDREVPYTRYDAGNAIAPFTFNFPDNVRETVSYTFYMGGDISECLMDTERKGMPDILIYGDSFTNNLECVLYACCGKMYSLDLRYYKGNVSDFILENEPDYVICARSFSTLLQAYANGGI